MDGGKWERVYHDYDAAGRLVRRRGGSDGATGYTLDAEGRVTAIANNSYSETLSFAANGLVTEKNTSVAYGGEKFVQRMEYGYGARRFLTAAICGESNLSPFTELFSETFDYDLNGNVTMINRGYPAVQEAAIEYEGNRVSRIVDSSSPAMAVYAPRFAEGEYDRPIVYDQCGRITADRTRRIASILYNDRHLPIRFTMDNGNTLSLSYNADGVKERETETSYYVTTVTRVENGDTVVREQKRARSTLREYYGDVLRVGGRTRRLEWSGGFFSKDDNGRWHSHRYVRNSLGSIVAVTDSAGTVEQAVCYYASGLPVYKAPNSIPATRRMHVGKEFEQFESIDWYDNEARFYDPLLVRFTTPDPLALSYPSLSPYAYCANNPVCNVDLDGRKVKPVGDAEFQMILKTLPKESREYVTLDSNGYIDYDSMSGYCGDSYNFNCLRTLVNDGLTIDVVLDNKYTYANKIGSLGTREMGYYEPNPEYGDEKDTLGISVDLLSTGEGGNLGKTLFPDRISSENSPNNNLIIVVNSQLSEFGRIETFSHEAYGHVLLYLLNGGDHIGASHKFERTPRGTIDSNTDLVNKILKAKKETIINEKQ